MTTAAVKIVVRGLLPSNDEWRNVFFFKGVGDFTNTSVTDWVTDLYTQLDMAAMPTGWKIYGADVSAHNTGMADTDPLSWGPSTYIPVTLAGSSVGETLPPGDCYVIVGQTGTKHVLGKKFVSGVLEGNQNGGVVIPAVVTNLTNFGNYWMTPASDPLGSGSTPCCWGPTHGFSPIVSIRADTHVYHLRRRQQGRGI